MTVRKIVLLPEIASYIHKLSDDPKILELLELSLGRVLDKAGRDGSFVMHLIDAEKASHITDWLAAAVLNGDKWLENVDSEGRPKKLMKFGDVASIIKEADKAMEKLAQRSRTITLVPGDEELYAELENGYYVVRLLTANALDRETGEMQHCAGGGAYDHKVATEEYDYLSLRDRFGKAHVTMELDLRQVRGPRMIQIFGKQNEAPDTRYALILMTMFREKGIRIGQVGGIVFDKHWNAHPIEALPERLSVWGSMDIRNVADLVLPAVLTVEGELTIDGCHNLTMPEFLRVGGDMYMQFCTLATQAEEVAVGRELSLVRNKTPATGIAASLRAFNIRSDKMRTWTKLADIDFQGFASMHNTGVSDILMLEAREKTRSRLKAEGANGGKENEGPTSSFLPSP